MSLIKASKNVVGFASFVMSAFVGYKMYKSWKKCCEYSKICDKKWIECMPKIELHAHLHGSIRMSLLAKLYQNLASNEDTKHLIPENEDPKEKIRYILKTHKTLNDCFPVFDVIHRVVSSKETLELITYEVLKDFAEQNVKYLELRSTPRELSLSNHSRRDYVDILLNCIENFPVKYPQYSDMIIRLILTIQNAKPLKESYETLDIVNEYYNDCKQNNIEPIIVGIDWAPRPIKNKEFKYFEDLLNKIKQAGINITIHFAEYYNREEQDLILNYRPDRLGHAINLKNADYNILLNNPIPIEMCPTSNIMTKSISNYNEHLFKVFMKEYKNNKLYPMIFCTDDFGVFETDLNIEWYNMCTYNNITKNIAKQLTLNAVQFIFGSQHIKDILHKKLSIWFQNN